MLERLPSAFRELFPGRESSCGSTFRSVLDIFSFFSYWTTHMLFDSTEWRPGRRSVDGRGGATRTMDRELAPVRIK